MVNIIKNKCLDAIGDISCVIDLLATLLWPFALLICVWEFIYIYTIYAEYKKSNIKNIETKEYIHSMTLWNLRLLTILTIYWLVFM